MKKTILATALTSLFAATAAQSATIYDADGVTVDVFGDSEVVILNSTAEGDSTYINIDDADFGFSLGYEFAEGYVVGTTIGFTGAGGGADLDEAYVSLMTDEFGTLKVGKQYTFYDDSGIGNDYQFGFTAFYEQDVAGQQVVKYSIDKETFYGGIAYVMDTEAEDASVVNTNGFDAMVGLRAAGFDFTVYYADIENANSTAGDDLSNINFEVRYAFEKLELSASYAISEHDDPTGNNVDTNFIGAAAVYDLDENIGFAGGIANIDPDADDSYLSGYVNTTYTFNDYVNVYAEVGYSDADDEGLGFATGMQVAF